MKKSVTIKDIAEATSMSIATVSAVLQGGENCLSSLETQARVRKVAQELGYHPNLMARGLKTGHFSMIGLLGSALQNEIKQSEMIALAAELEHHHYSMVSSYYLAESSRLTSGCLNLMQRGCDGLLISDLPVDYHGDELADYAGKYVAITHCRHHVQEPNIIYYDYEPGIRQALEYLKKAGHRKFGFVLNVDAKDQRTIYYPQIAAELNLDYRLVRPPAQPGSILTTFEWFRQFLRDYPATALIFSNDLLALQGWHFALELGLKVPQDLSIVGFDDIQSAAAAGLSTIKQPVKLAARSAIHQLLNQIDHQTELWDKIIPVEFMPRYSCGPVRN